MSEIQTQTVQIPNGPLLIDAYLAQPVGLDSCPAVIVFQEIFGVNAHIRDVTDRIAREGYVAIAPALYQRTAPGFDVGYTDAEVQLGRSYKVQTTAAELLSDTQAAISYLRTHPQVGGQAIGCIGFCFGGHVAYLAATLPEIIATASFYGAGIATLTPGGGAPTVSLTDQIQGTMNAFFGTQDPLIPNPEIDQIEAALQEQPHPHRLFRYPTGHGFFCDRRASYHPDSAADAWEKVCQLFQTTLTTP
jgi:carboxymethylenebutenolidase